jgi:hypothetical protein
MAFNLDLSFLNDLDSVIEDIDVKDLEIDPAVQRPEDRTKINRLAKNFTPSGLGTITVSRRIKPIRNIVLDGQTRLRVVEKVGAEHGVTSLRTEVFEKLTHAQEAALFVTLNDNTKAKATERFRMAVEAGEPVSVAISGLLSSYGFVLATYPSNKAVSAVDVMRRIYERSERQDLEPNTLQLVLLTIDRAWGGATEYANKGIMMDALAAVYDEYGDQIVVAEFIDRLRDQKPQVLIHDGQQQATYKKVKPTMGLAEVLVGVYNTDARGRRRTGKSRLWDWGRRK